MASSSDAPLPEAAAAANPVAAEKTWLERQRERKRELAAVRLTAKAELKAGEQQSAKDRLAYLMRQTDVFAHFIKPAGGEGGGGGGGDGGGAGRRKKGRLTERQEDELMMQSAQQEQGASANAAAAGSGTRLTAQPSCIQNGAMRPYQLEGLNWLIKLYEHGINGILADEMGLGKTLQTISLLGYLKECRGVSGPHLIIVPKSTLSNWHRELTKWCPSLRAFKVRDAATPRRRFSRLNPHASPPARVRPSSTATRRRGRRSRSST